MSFGESTGTWSQDGNLITMNYTTYTGNEMEMSLDIVDEGDITYLRNRESGKQDGSVITWSINEYYPESKADEIRASVAKKPGETVSTDIIDLTIDSAEFCYYASATNNQTWVTPLAESDGGIFKTNKGRTFVALTFTITNNDRSTLHIADSFNGGWYLSWIVNYHNAGYSVNTFDLNDKNGSYGLNFTFSAISKDGGETFTKHDTMNYLLPAGQTITVRTLGLVVMEPDSLDDSFDLIVNVPGSDGSEKFIYSIE